MSEKQRERGVQVLWNLYRKLLRELTEDVLDNEEAIAAFADGDMSHSFSVQKIEDKYLPRLTNLQHLLAYLQRPETVAEKRPEYKVRTVVAARNELDSKLNSALSELSGAQIDSLTVEKVTGEEFLATILYHAAAPARQPRLME